MGIERPAREAAAPRSELLWRPRHVAVARSVAQYSRFVSMMKIALPATAAFLLLLVILLPQFRGDDERFRVGAMPEQPASDPSTLSMVNARYFGTDSKGQPFSITAQAVRERSAPSVSIELVKPQADISLANGSWISASANEGVYDREQEVLDLSGEVSLFQDHGYEIHTPTARVFLQTSSAQGNDPVNGHGPAGRLDAAGFELHDSGQRIVFKGPAHLVLGGAGRSDGTNEGQKTR